MASDSEPWTALVPACRSRTKPGPGSAIVVSMRDEPSPALTGTSRVPRVVQPVLPSGECWTSTFSDLVPAGISLRLSQDFTVTRLYWSTSALWPGKAVPAVVSSHTGWDGDFSHGSAAVTLQLRSPENHTT